MKSQRQAKILEIIEKYEVGTQEELIRRLKDDGYDVTQTTVSRDIRQLKLVKGLTSSGEYRYLYPSARKEQAPPPVLNSALADSVLKVEAAQNILVVKTSPGMANAVAVCIDTIEHPYIVGSVAGDDTVLLILKDNTTAIDIEKKLKEVFKL